ncbi:hypothetical protein KO507_10460 [Gilvimarinus agarilyticus]|uniref:Uncharacterized protein n=1 Tax=Reichenbachiella agariperforans TaxID=156994 RepID=A0A1M6N1L1_REIAG|nr:DUF5995 family protein [Reichenbachiella agariperforans]MBU2886184.1 hypothetical protein [Gilvimarinus agarilyticus]MBU2915680.1 hypothetical protein [Reichenbachiella agariperforans]SHJ89542.1 hypothetical protein SAMN04488028_10255 [Reichenbachiella agariperforans]
MQTIENVVERLDRITEDSMLDFDPMGYFSAAYYAASTKIMVGVRHNVFEQSHVVEDIYLTMSDRFFDERSTFMKDTKTTGAWQSSFGYLDSMFSMVLQQVMTGIHVHVSLDLAVAVAQVGGERIDRLKGDFDKVFDMFKITAERVEEDMTDRWPTTKFVLKIFGVLDSYFVHYNFEKAREETWAFAKELAQATPADKESLIKQRNEVVAQKTKLVKYPGVIMTVVFAVMRMFELGNVAKKTQRLMSLWK